MAHNHEHGGSGHSHAPADFGRAFAIGIALNTGFVIVEATFGVLSHSLALVADAGHNLSDVLGLLLAWGASVLVRRVPTPRRTYGLRRSSILAALFNAVFLLVAVGGIAWEAVGRFRDPAPVQGGTVIGVALIGIVINTATALLFMSGRKGDLNIRGAFLHMAADAGVSLRRRARGRRHPIYGPALARPPCQPADRRRDFVGNVGIAEGFGQPRARRRAGRN